ncbi:formylglycine-generating enzyme family protein, partial [uncultured Thiodictyon sp.]|uniref:formylglycine-generating enzyme family protein n=1 Tax=uncultured Thiodictyon sp. TaxID=1846217 RepID=UPI0025DCAA56
GPIPPRPAGPRPRPSPAPGRAAAGRAAISADRGAELLLSLLSPCIAITPPLLRHLRHRLPAGLARVGSEAACWQHPAFVGGDLPLVPGNRAAIQRLRRAFASAGTPAQRRLAWHLIQAQQETVEASVAVRMEERALYAAMCGSTDDAAETFLDKVADTLLQTRERGAAGDEQRLIGWVDRRTGRSHREVWDFSPGTHRLRLLAHPEAAGAGAVNPEGFDIYRALAAAGRPKQPRSWRLVQRGDWLEWESTAAPAETFGSGSPVVSQMPTGWPVVEAQEACGGAPWQSLGLDPANGGVGALPLAAAGWRLRTDFEELSIAPMDRPAWAHTLGRDGDGLFVGFTDGDGERRAYWCAPLEWLRWPGSPVRPALESPWDGHGCFIDEGQYRALRSRGLALGRGGRTLSRDRLGLRLEIAIEGVPIGLRWVWPGSFLMGSSESEKGRDADETRHEVILTRGLWLAETACTQALWEAVMGENPSHAKGPQRPVEQVSWEQVQGFIERLNAGLAASLGASVDPASPDAAERSAQRTLRFRLPTEAEWEYACRAGTMTAYSFGDDFDPKLANNGSETVAVRSLPPNPWGFYEMHGNVWEWCQDWFGDYPTGAVVDPEGAASGEGRVLRGGGWALVALYLRSAFRFLYDPGLRSLNAGFRLALGPEPGQAGEGRQAGWERGRTVRAGSEQSERKARAVRSRGAEGSKGA